MGGVLLQQSMANAIMGSSSWDGTSKAPVSVVSVSASSQNTFIIAQNDTPAGAPVWASDRNTTNTGGDIVLSLSLASSS